MRASGGADRIRRYADAARHLRPRQIAARPRRLVPARLLAAGLTEQPPPRWRPLAAGAGVDPAPQSGPQPPPHLDGVFRAVGAQRRFTPGRWFWVEPGDGLLFLFELHGFGGLARYSAGPPDRGGDAFWVAVLESWLEECGRFAGPGWHPYPTSGRLIAWSAALSRGGWPAELAERLRASAWLQARVLARSVEHDVGGNHVLHNAAALTVAGACLGDDRLRDRGVALLERQLGTQLLADGGHEERSPSYQRAIRAEVEDVAAVLERAGHPAAARLRDEARRMSAWLTELTGPDGALPLLNDGWEGPPLERRSPAPVADLDASGYVVLRHGDDQAVLDLGALGPAHLPAHAHADALSFVLWVDGAQVVVDPGSRAYAGPDRDAFRATRAHSTVEVDGADQCEFWGPFRAAFLPDVRRGPIRRGDGHVIVAGRHDGYRRLPDPVTHHRTFCWLPGDGLVVVDRLEASAEHAVRSSLQLPPGADGLGPLTALTLDGEAPDARPARYSPHLGAESPSRALVQERRVRPGEPFGWLLLRTRDARAVVEPAAVTVERPGRDPVRIAL